MHDGEKTLKGRKCFGHLGGTLGERLFDKLVELEWFRKEEGTSTVYSVTEKGFEELQKLGVDIYDKGRRRHHEKL